MKHRTALKLAMTAFAGCVLADNTLAQVYPIPSDHKHLGRWRRWPFGDKWPATLAANRAKSLLVGTL